MDAPVSRDEPPLVAIRVFPKLALAREAALALAAREIVHRIDRERSLWVLSVEEPFRGEAEVELAAYEAEQRESPEPAAEREPGEPVEFWALLAGGAVLAAAFRAQQYFGE